jgi:flagellar protein FlaG
MGTVLAARGVIPQQELPQEREFAKQAQARAAKTVSPTVAEERFESTLPIMADLERVSLALNRRLKFEVDHESHEVTVKVIDGETDKVIRELPPEELRRMHTNIKKTLEETIGFLFDERV